MSDGDREILEAIKALTDEIKDLATEPAVQPDKAPPNTTAIPNALVFALILMLLGYAFGLPAYMRGYHDENTPPPEVRIKDAEHDRRLDELSDRVRSLERGNTP